ncbi:hypothetical protein HU200_002494 [Digitaria exilis]|uniref:DUF4220 domain-containing protein n=1 Tax=Digitaria exilis TaxID=1010633 RepID=A0A835BCW7_9POAL|nr:hypothetical protein HU200_038133 [Digitaria exilis]KAF8779560.1 hypothetical protein HU200_002494 [Digitaria exilis]
MRCKVLWALGTSWHDMVSAIAVAIYVFRKSFTGEKKLLQAAILIFVPGILKCLEKPWALKSASINSISKSSGSWVARMLQEEQEDENKDITSLEEYVQTASKHVRGHQDPIEEFPLFLKAKPYRLFVDLAYSYSDRLKNLVYMQNKDIAHRQVRSYLSMTFDRLYTKNAVYKGLNYFDCSCKNCCGYHLRVVIQYLVFAAIPLFHLSH